jgi:hypothetical protein
MSGKIKKPPKKPKKVYTILSAELADFLDEQASVEKKSRTALLRDLIEISLTRRSIDRFPPIDPTELHSLLLQEAAKIKSVAESREASGNREGASSAYLCAAAREMEAASLLSLNDDVRIKSSLLLTIYLIKKGTGYRHLPETPVSPRSVEIWRS